MEQHENLYTTDCIRTYTGKYMNVFNPTPDMISIVDIAHALSNQSRFGGHLPTFYSVAQHSILCHMLAPGYLKKEALMHDASEAYLIDVPKPIKNRLTNYKEIEDNLMTLIAHTFSFKFPLNEIIHKVDKQCIQLEWDYLMLCKPYREGPLLLKMREIFSWDPKKTEFEFLKTFNRV